MSSRKPQSRLRSKKIGAVYLERTEQAFIHAHHSSSVIKFAAVVRRTEKGHQLPFREEFVTVFDDLMCSADQVHVMFLQEPGDHIRTEREGDSAIILTPPCDVLVRIRPEKVTEQAAIWNLHRLSVAEGSKPPRASFDSAGQNKKVLLTSVGRMTRRICSIEFKSGLNPPCMVNIFSSIMAAIGKQLKQSVNVFHSLMLYLLLHSS